MNLGRRAVNETEIIKRRYLPLLSVNPRSNKAAAGRRAWRRYGERRDIFHFSFSRGRMAATARGGKEGRFLDDFLITRSQSRVSARRKRHFARTAGRQLARETKVWCEDAVGTIQDLCYLLRTRGGRASTCRGNGIGGKEERNVKVVPADI